MKRANKNALFTLSLWYERFFIISYDLQMMQIMDKKDADLSLKVYQYEMLRIKDISSEGQITKCPYKYWFTLVTASRDYKLFAPTREERDLWVEGFYRLLFVPIANFKLKACVVPDLKEEGDTKEEQRQLVSALKADIDKEKQNLDEER